MQNPSTIQVWDIFVRLFHWTLVLAFAVAYVSSEAENELHIYAGYTVLGLIVFRVFWGLIGSKYAKFKDFIYSPKTVYHYIKSSRAGTAQHYLGHNPLGGWMVLAMLIMLFVVTLSGLKVYAIEEGAGLLAANHVNLAVIANANAEEEDDDDDAASNGESAEKFWEEAHEISTNLLLVLIGLHIFGVVLHSRLHKENLVKAMLTGKKNIP